MNSHKLSSCRAAIITLYRRFLTETPHGVPAQEQDSWKTFAKNKVRAAASHATQALNSMMAEDLMKFAQTVTYVLSRRQSLFY